MEGRAREREIERERDTERRKSREKREREKERKKEREKERERERLRPQPPFGPSAFGPSVASLCHPCIPTTHLPYRSPIFETAIQASQQLTSPIGLLSLKLPPPPCFYTFGI